jgi:hypothetical protein
VETGGGRYVRGEVIFLSMKILLNLFGLVLIIVAVNSLTTVGQEPAKTPPPKPDFSGKWQLVDKESDRTGIFRMVITIKDDLLTIYPAYIRPTINDYHFETLGLKLDKSGETNRIMNMDGTFQEVKSVTKLNGDKLVRKFQSITVIPWVSGGKSRIYYDNTEIYSLSKDGNRLTIVLQSSAPPRPVSQIITAGDTPTRVTARVYSRVP